MLKMKMLLAASLMAGLPAAVHAQAAPAPAANAPGAAMSAASQQIVKDMLAKRNAELTPLAQRKQALEQQFASLLTPQSYDEAKLEATMTEMKQVEGQLFDGMGRSMLAILKALPAPDRAIFMNSISQTPPQPATPPAGPGR